MTDLAVNGWAQTWDRAMISRITIFIGLVTCFASAGEAGPPEAIRPANFAEHWRRSHPFYVTGSHFNHRVFRWDDYLAGHFNLFLASGVGLLEGQHGTDMPLPLWVGANQVELTEESRHFLRQVAQTPGITGWYVRDEPHYQLFEGVGRVTAWLKRECPKAVTFCVAFPSTAKPEQMWGDATNPKYTYSEYLNDFVNIVDPDMVAYNHYPFTDRFNLHPQFFENLMMVRNKAQSLGKPYAAAIQSFDASFVRMPSESDLRMQVFSYLAAGYDALGYFTYSHHGHGAIMDEQGKPTRLYEIVKQVNLEAIHLGNVLRDLAGTDVRFIPGRSGHSLPAGLRRWAPGAGGDLRIRDIEIAHPRRRQELGADENGLIGFFGQGDKCLAFLLVNLNHGAGLPARLCELEFKVLFEEDVTRLHTFSRYNGQEEAIDLPNHELTVLLPGGTGNLYAFEALARPVARDGEGPPEAPGGSPTSDPPRITREPGSLRIEPHETARFRIAANGRQLKYRWYKDGVPLMNGEDIEAADRDALVVRHLDSYNAGTYRCIVSNAAGRAVSSPATLTLIKAPSRSADSSP